MSFEDRDLAALPYPALAYFAARCAGKVGPLYARCWEGAPGDHHEAVLEAALATERFATSPDSPFRAETLEQARVATARAADAAIAADAADAPAASVHAADAAAELSSFLREGRDRRHAVRATRRVVEASRQAVRDAAPELDAELQASLASELDVLRLHASTENWTDTDGIPPVLRGAPTEEPRAGDAGEA